MESKGDIKHESDRSSDEKVVAANLEAPHAYVADLPPDPDAHLSPEERAAIVSLPKMPQKATFLAHGLTALLGSQTPLEAGFDVDSMGKLLFSSLCENADRNSCVSCICCPSWTEQTSEMPKLPTLTPTSSCQLACTMRPSLSSSSRIPFSNPSRTCC
jgi:hypothetical protein